MDYDERIFDELLTISNKVYSLYSDLQDIEIAIATTGDNKNNIDRKKLKKDMIVLNSIISLIQSIRETFRS